MLTYIKYRFFRSGENWEGLAICGFRVNNIRGMPINYASLD